MKNDIWSQKSIEESIRLCLDKRLIFLVYIQGDDEKWIDNLLTPQVCKEIKEKTVSLRLFNGTIEAMSFKQMVVVNSVPSIFLIKDGLVKKSFYGNATAENLIEGIQSLSREKSMSNISEYEGACRNLLNIQEKDGISSIKSAKMNSKDGGKRKKYVEELKKMKKKDLEERMCILARINADKEERKVKEQYRISARSNEVSIFTEDTSFQQSAKNICLLNIRLLNGSSIQAKHFTINNTLQDVRQWIDENRTDNKIPYDLIQVYPKRLFSISEEVKTLEVLNLYPSATLVLKPIKNAISAYVNLDKGYFSKLFGAFGYFKSNIYSIFGWISAVINKNKTIKKMEQNKKVHSLNDQQISTSDNRNRDKNVWYNGNTLNQEPPVEKNN
ncbi:hypothetical protein PNEG_02292 [Pneumocystis murina B123]|uniref:UBX domain-containing protein n=1 Tax=Pneumocystis murina (strain B123) TaxID=1069680 RepID=M7NQ01_PNEMU|nr:hypothetical protein PNEG_02292 [Pneumocystis murina B123]EMR09337.1 hypothetical protein PNEG_02292 [Pneumocystis murina B123]